MVVIFDWDGTLHDSNQAVMVSWVNTAQRFGIQKTEVDVLNALGGTTGDVARILGFEEDQIDEAVNNAIGEFLKITMNNNLLFRGVPEVLKELSQDYQLALYSNGHLDIVEKLLRKHKLRNYFDIIVTSETAIKPDPKGIELILDHVKKGMGVMVDDDAVGIEAAKKAGIKSIGALYGMNPKQLLLSKPHALVNSVTEVPLAVRKLI